MDLLVRVDGNSEIGIGHVMRCLAIAQKWIATSGSVFFVMKDPPNKINSRLIAEKVNVAKLKSEAPGSIDDVEETADIAAHNNIKTIIVDGYHFDSYYQKALKDRGLTLMVLDDYNHAEHHYADLILNQNCILQDMPYSNRETYTEVLNGPEFILLRDEFTKAKSKSDNIQFPPTKLLISLGGSDSIGTMPLIVKAIQQPCFKELETVIIGGSNTPMRSEVKKLIDSQPHSIKLLEYVDNIREHIDWADLMISAAGSTVWEITYLGTPCLIIPIAENQRPIAEFLGKNKVCINLGWHEDITGSDITNTLLELIASREKQEEMIRAGKTLTDGQGVERVIRKLQGKTIGLRKASMDDCKIVWEWSNDPSVRRSSFSQEEIGWEEHVDWYEGKMKDKDCYFYIAEGEQNPIGQVRFQVDRKAKSAVISVSIGKSYRKLGLGSSIIALGSWKLFEEAQTPEIHAYIKKDNARSVHAFQRAGFTNNADSADNEDILLKLYNKSI